MAFVDQVGTAPGGAERTLATFLKFIPHDIEPMAILFEDGAFAEELRTLGITVDVISAPEAVGSATREHFSLASVFQSALMAARLARTLRRTSADVVYTNSMKAHFVGSLAALMAGKPCVTHFHDLFHGLPLLALRATARLCSRERIACSVLVSKAIDAGPTSVIYGPVELSAYDSLGGRAEARRRLGVADDLPLVALVGRINRWKGHDSFVRIAARVNEVVPARFLIVGSAIFRDEDFVPELKALVADLGLEERVSFIPWLDDVRDVYAAIDVNANCSVREPFGRTIVEAAAAGVPTVCYRDSGGSETIVDRVTGRIISPGDEAAFADAIVAYLGNTDSSAVASATKAAARDFGAPKIAVEMANVIRRARC